MMRGFLVAEFADDFKNASEQLAKWVQEGKIKTQVSIEEKVSIKYLKHLEIYSLVIILVNK